MEAVLAGHADGWINPHVDKTFSFEDAAGAHQYIEQRIKHRQK